MLIDMTGLGPERRVHIEVPSIDDAARFYGQALQAQEVFRLSSPEGLLLKLGIDIGGLGLTITPKGEEEDSMSLASLAKDLDAPFLGLIVYVADPAQLAQRVIQAGGRFHPDAALAPSYGGKQARMVVDPFGNVWAFAQK